MADVGVFSDSGGDLELFDAALNFLSAKGARRFLFAGGNYEDLEAWVRWKRSLVRLHTDYSNLDFLEDVSRFLMGEQSVDRPPAFGRSWELALVTEELTRMESRIVRAPERGGAAWSNAAIPRKVFDLVGDVICCLVHDRNDLNKDDLFNAALLVHGKEAEPQVVNIGPRTFVTPGSLGGTSRPTVGLFSCSGRLSYAAFSLDGTQVLPAVPIGGRARSRTEAT
jgi:hypothetical protein